MDNYEIKVYDNNKEEIIAIIRGRWLKFRIEPRKLKYRGFELSRFDNRLSVLYYFDTFDFNDKLEIYQYDDFSVIADKIVAVINEAKDKIDEYLKEQKQSESNKTEKSTPVFRRFKL